MKAIYAIFFSLLFFISGCAEECQTGVYTGDGSCCTYVCNKQCDYGYV